MKMGRKYFLTNRKIGEEKNKPGPGGLVKDHMFPFLQPSIKDYW